MVSIGIMQGRLTQALGRGIQFFPFEEWREEFEKAHRIGLNEIEWIFDYYNYQNNPLWTKEGQTEINNIIQNTGIKVHSICWDYFMRRPFYKCDPSIKETVLNENKYILKQVFEAMHEIGAGLIEIPLVDDSSLKAQAEKGEAVSFIQWACDNAAEYDIMVGLETDFPPGIFRDFLSQIGRDNIKANYDSGNSSGIGYDHREELLSLDQYVYNVHIKDRIKGNGTVKLGTGSADFDKVFGTLKEIGYHGSFILQAARGKDGEEEETIAEYIKFVKNMLEQYKMG
ncbi:MAG: sugar phosphate isomerase/epimerase [Clostridium sp.]|nr:sugar phosphate isomerase/epimerase [Clostridium sp.]MCM1560258.1 sugar phosphate isomerase/epimerase [Butyrivibrio sp.]